MKPTFNKYWILISLIVIMNILVFVFLSKKLESYVADRMIEDQLTSQINF
ncbi:MAG: hypothetical protein WCT42_03310 [Candidatus Paceibacterota bacterium]